MYIFHIWLFYRDSNFVEPQILALVSLSVDCIISCYLQGKSEQLENYDEDNDDGNIEPSSKRRKISEPETGDKKEVF